MNCQIHPAEQRVELQGDVTMKSVHAIPKLPCSEGESWLVDLSQVQTSDSVLLALLCGFERQCADVGSELKVVEMPEKMVNLTGLYGLKERLGV